MLCAGLALAMVTMPEYVPGPRPAGLAVTLTVPDPYALSVALAGDASSHAPPEVVLVAVENARDPAAGDWKSGKLDGFARAALLNERKRPANRDSRPCSVVPRLSR